MTGEKVELTGFLVRFTVFTTIWLDEQNKMYCCEDEDCFGMPYQSESLCEHLE